MRTSVFNLLIGAALSTYLWTASAHAQLPTYDPTGVTTLQSCPINLGFYSDQNHQPTCYTGTINCPNTASIAPTWSITNPTGTSGTIVFFGGGGGRAPLRFRARSNSTHRHTWPLAIKLCRWRGLRTGNW